MDTMRSPTAPLLWRGILAVIVGVIAVGWPDITIGAFVILFAAYAFLAAGMEAARAFRSVAAGPLAGRLLLAVLDAAAGAVALIWPDITALALVLLVAAWAFVTGIWEVAFAFKSGETAGQRALLGLTGLVTIALSVVFAIRPDLGAATIADVFGLSSITLGVAALVIAANLHRDTAVARRAVSAA
jgi:uncharacterized membrane protein HdeD (DUF308 family)